MATVRFHPFFLSPPSLIFLSPVLPFLFPLAACFLLCDSNLCCHFFLPFFWLLRLGFLFFFSRFFLSIFLFLLASISPTALPCAMCARPSFFLYPTTHLKLFLPEEVLGSSSWLFLKSSRVLSLAALFEGPQVLSCRLKCVFSSARKPRLPFEAPRLYGATEILPQLSTCLLVPLTACLSSHPLGEPNHPHGLLLQHSLGAELNEK